MQSGGRQVEIKRGGVGDVDDLRALWIELHHHHQRVGPQSGTFTDDETSWSVRSASYREWLADDGSFLLLARAEAELIGYALVRVMPAGPELRDAWVVPDRVAELETLVVTATMQGAGTGERLLDAVDAELERIGITELLVGLIPGNDGAQRLYERRGFRPRWLLLVRDEPPDR